jgi:hypothetical protein
MAQLSKVKKSVAKIERHRSRTRILITRLIYAVLADVVRAFCLRERTRMMA